jgi:hypothetical protein
MIIDIHAHYHPRAYLEALTRTAARRGPGTLGNHSETDDAAHVQARP